MHRRGGSFWVAQSLRPQVRTGSKLHAKVAPFCASANNSGKFEGSPANLQALIAQGEVEGTDHVDASDIHRSLAARNEFLAAHGYDHVPEGYEVHHVVPLSEGGTDTPDNMILLTEEEHDAVTAAHRRFYEWNA